MYEAHTSAVAESASRQAATKKATAKDKRAGAEKRSGSEQRRRDAKAEKALASAKVAGKVEKERRRKAAEITRSMISIIKGDDDEDEDYSDFATPAATRRPPASPAGRGGARRGGGGRGGGGRGRGRGGGGRGVDRGPELGWLY